MTEAQSGTWYHPKHGVGWKENPRGGDKLHLSRVREGQSLSGTQHISYTDVESALADGWELLIRPKLPRYNLYVCEYGCHNVTVDVDKGTTPFMMRCKRKSTASRKIGGAFVDENGQCIGTAKSNFYPTVGVPRNIVATHEWFKPNFLELLHFHSEEEQDHVQKGGLLLRPRTDKEVIYHD